MRESTSDYDSTTNVQRVPDTQSELVDSIHHNHIIDSYTYDQC